MESKAKILIVEDDESQRLLYSEELREEGYVPLLARNGKEAIQVIKKTRPDLIILDIFMPVMDGMEALGRIVSKHKGIPIILYSSSPNYQQDFMSWTADAYLVKSSDLTELKETVKRLISQRPSEIQKANPHLKKEGVKKGER